MSNKGKIFAVLHGKIIGIDKLPQEIENNLKNAVYRISDRIYGIYPKAYTFCFSILDSKIDRIYAVLAEPSLAIEIALMFIVSFKQVVEPYDCHVRFTIGFGEIDKMPRTADQRGEGQAYDLAHQLMNETKDNQYLTVKSTNDNLNVKINSELTRFNINARDRKSFLDEIRLAIVKDQISRQTVFKFPRNYQNPNSELAYSILDNIYRTKDIIIQNLVNLAHGGEENKERYLYDLIERKLEEGEDSIIEFKSKLFTSDDKVFKEIVGMLNSHGGTILVGIKDDGTVCGIDEDLNQFENKQNPINEIQKKLENIINHCIGKHLGGNIHIKHLKYQSKIIFIITVVEVRKIQCFKNDIYMRTGSSCSKLGPEDIKKLRKNHPEKF